MLHDLLLLAISKSGLDRAPQGFRVEGPAQERDGSSPAGPHPSLLVAMRGVDDERNAIPLAYQLLLELVTAHAGHLEIEHEARGRARPIRSQELLGRRKCRNGRSNRSEEPGERRRIDA
jgi:hypothetical protein